MTQNSDEIDDPDYREIAQLLDGAKGTVVDDRGDTHGHPRENLQHTADMWAAYLETDVSPTDVAMMLLGVVWAILLAGLFTPETGLAGVAFASIGLLVIAVFDDGGDGDVGGGGR